MNNNIILEMTVEEVNSILTGLLELPAKFSMDLINKIRGQALPQIAGMENGGKAVEDNTESGMA